MSTALHSLGFLAGCKRRDVRRLDGLSNRLTYRAGTTITDDVANGKQIVVVCTGTVVVGFPTGAVTTAGSGTIVATLLPIGQRHDALGTALHALTDCDLLVIDRREFGDLQLRARSVADRMVGGSDSLPVVQSDRAAVAAPGGVWAKVG